LLPAGTRPLRTVDPGEGLNIMSEAMSSHQELSSMLSGAWITQAIYVAAELGIADLLADGPRPVEELADLTATDTGALYRLLRTLAGTGIFAEEPPRRFTITPLAEPLRSDFPGSQRAMAIMMGAELYETWGQLLHSVRTGRGGFRKAFGSSFFQYMTENPDRHGIYDAAMNGVHGRETEPILDAGNFSRFHRVVDVGGGNGEMLMALLRRHPALRGTLFDLPGVVERARHRIEASDLADRCRIEGGDFFSAVPTGADAYLLRHIIHDWSDEKAVTILSHCQQAMGPEGKVLVIETVIHPGNEPCFGRWLDLMMLLVDGRERTEEQYRDLFAQAGLRLDRIIPTAAGVSILEGTRSDSSKNT